MYLCKNATHDFVRCTLKDTFLFTDYTDKELHFRDIN